MRRYEHGQLVGEPEPAKTFEEILTWISDECDLARRRIDKTPKTQVMDRSYLVGRAAVLGDLLTMFARMPKETP